MRNFDITDIVTVNDNDEILYIVVDYIDYSEKAPNGKEIIDIDYELIKIYPIEKNSKYINLGQDEITLKERLGTKKYDLLLSLIQKDRERVGWYGMPEYIDVATANLKMKELKTMPQKTKPKVKKLDKVRYDLIETIDQCLDAINDLKLLYDAFNDNDYLEEIEKVKARIIRLNM